jgi:hypothetical protein
MPTLKGVGVGNILLADPHTASSHLEEWGIYITSMQLARVLTGLQHMMQQMLLA